MKKSFINLLFVLLATLLLAASCQDEFSRATVVGESSFRDHKLASRIDVLPSPDASPETKSSFAGSETRIDNWSLIQVDAETDKVVTLYSWVRKNAGDSPDISNIAVKYGVPYRWYAVANAALPGSVAVGATRATVEAMVLSCVPKDSTSTAATIPMAWKSEGTMSYAKPGSGQTLTPLAVEFTRLVSKWSIVLDRTQLSKYDFTATGLEIKGTGTVKAFSTSKASSALTVTDRATSSDIAAFDGGNAAVFYTLENLCGGGTAVLKSYNAADPDASYKKKASNIKDGVYPSYVEVTGTLSFADGSGMTTSGKYRFYPGENVIPGAAVSYDFNVGRNRYTTITLQPTDEWVANAIKETKGDSDWDMPEPIWKVEAGDFTDSRTIRWQHAYPQGSGVLQLPVDGSLVAEGVVKEPSSLEGKIQLDNALLGAGVKVYGNAGKTVDLTPAAGSWREVGNVSELYLCAPANHAFVQGTARIATLDGRKRSEIVVRVGKVLENLTIGLWPDASTAKFHSDTTFTFNSTNTSGGTFWAHVYAWYSDGSKADVTSQVSFTYPADATYGSNRDAMNNPYFTISHVDGSTDPSIMGKHAVKNYGDYTLSVLGYTDSYATGSQTSFDAVANISVSAVPQSLTVNNTSNIKLWSGGIHASEPGASISSPHAVTLNDVRVSFYGIGQLRVDPDACLWKGVRGNSDYTQCDDYLRYDGGGVLTTRDRRAWGTYGGGTLAYVRVGYPAASPAVYAPTFYVSIFKKPVSVTCTPSSVYLPDFVAAPADPGSYSSMTTTNEVKAGWVTALVRFEDGTIENHDGSANQYSTYYGDNYALQRGVYCSDSFCWWSVDASRYHGLWTPKTPGLNNGGLPTSSVLSQTFDRRLTKESSYVMFTEGGVEYSPSSQPERRVTASQDRSVATITYVEKGVSGTQSVSGTVMGTLQTDRVLDHIEIIPSEILVSEAIGVSGDYKSYEIQHVYAYFVGESSPVEIKGRADVTWEKIDPHCFKFKRYNNFYISTSDAVTNNYFNGVRTVWVYKPSSITEAQYNGTYASWPELPQALYTVSYTYNGVTKSATITGKAATKTATSLEVVVKPGFETGQIEPDVAAPSSDESKGTNLQAIVTYSDNTTSNVTNDAVWRWYCYTGSTWYLNSFASIEQIQPTPYESYYIARGATLDGYVHVSTSSYNSNWLFYADYIDEAGNTVTGSRQVYSRPSGSVTTWLKLLARGPGDSDYTETPAPVEVGQTVSMYGNHNNGTSVYPIMNLDPSEMTVTGGSHISLASSDNYNSWTAVSEGEVTFTLSRAGLTSNTVTVNIVPAGHTPVVTYGLYVSSDPSVINYGGTSELTAYVQRYEDGIAVGSPVNVSGDCSWYVAYPSDFGSVTRLSGFAKYYAPSLGSEQTTVMVCAEYPSSGATYSEYGLVSAYCNITVSASEFLNVTSPIEWEYYEFTTFGGWKSVSDYVTTSASDYSVQLVSGSDDFEVSNTTKIVYPTGPNYGSSLKTGRLKITAGTMVDYIDLVQHYNGESGHTRFYDKWYLLPHGSRTTDAGFGTVHFDYKIEVYRDAACTDLLITHTNPSNMYLEVDGVLEGTGISKSLWPDGRDRSFTNDSQTADRTYVVKLKAFDGNNLWSYGTHVPVNMVDNENDITCTVTVPHLPSPPDPVYKWEHECYRLDIWAEKDGAVLTEPMSPHVASAELCSSLSDEKVQYVSYDNGVTWSPTGLVQTTVNVVTSNTTFYIESQSGDGPVVLSGTTISSDFVATAVVSGSYSGPLTSHIDEVYPVEVRWAFPTPRTLNRIYFADASGSEISNPSFDLVQLSPYGYYTVSKNYFLKAEWIDSNSNVEVNDISGANSFLDNDYVYVDGHTIYAKTYNYDGNGFSQPVFADRTLTASYSGKTATCRVSGANPDIVQRVWMNNDNLQKLGEGRFKIHFDALFRKLLSGAESTAYTVGGMSAALESSTVSASCTFNASANEAEVDLLSAGQAVYEFTYTHSDGQTASCRVKFIRSDSGFAADDMAVTVY